MAKKIITKEQIFQTGIHLANTMPPGALTVAALCAELGIVKSTFYHYYRCLKDVFTDIMLQAAEDTLRKMPEIVLSEQSNVEKIEALWLVATDKFVEYGPRPLGYVLQFDELDTHEKHFYYQEPFMGTVKALIRRAQEAGEITNPAAPEAMFYIMHTYFAGHNLSWTQSDGGYDYRAYLKQGIQGILGVDAPLEIPQIYREKERGGGH